MASQPPRLASSNHWLPSQPERPFHSPTGVGHCTDPSSVWVQCLTQDQMPEALELLHRDPVMNVAVLGWLQASQGNPARLGAQLWGYWSQDSQLHAPQLHAPQLHALCYAGANMVPTYASESAVRAFAHCAQRWGKRCSSIVGPASSVSLLWEYLEPLWGPARQIRHRQPVMMLDQQVLVEPNPHVKMVTPDQLDVLLPASIAMFTEEVGVSPVDSPGRMHAYRARLAQQIAQGHVFAWIDRDQVLFKAEVGALVSVPSAPMALADQNPSMAWSDQNRGVVAQVQGVWLAQHLRRKGMAAGAVAAVAQMVQVFIAPQVCLYVNDFNLAARSTYGRVGFRDVATAMTVML